MDTSTIFGMKIIYAAVHVYTTVVSCFWHVLLAGPIVCSGMFLLPTDL